MVKVLVIAGAHSGVGKTTLSVGLMLALRQRGLVVQPFKVGPDFLDPLHHAAACGRSSINLDGWMLNRQQVMDSFHRHTVDADVAVVEGVMGLFDSRDGASDDGSTAQIAKWLGAPVALVVDCWAMARSAAALVKGYAEFDPDLQMCGVLLNKVGGAAHGVWLAEALNAAWQQKRLQQQVQVLGCIPKADGISVPERYLGLTMPHEQEEGEAGPHQSPDDTHNYGTAGSTALHQSAECTPAAVPPYLSRLAEHIRQHVDLDLLLDVAAVVPTPAGMNSSCSMQHGNDHEQEAANAQGTNNKGCPGQALLLSWTPPRLCSCRIAVARDAAFCFYYQDNLSLLIAAGAEVVFFSPLSDTHLPQNIAGIYFGGGYPERYAQQLSDNSSMLREVHQWAAAGGVVYAECGGLMYLCQGFDPSSMPQTEQNTAVNSSNRDGNNASDSSSHEGVPLVGVLPFTARMGGMKMGYVDVEVLPGNPLFPPGMHLRGQVYHFSKVLPAGDAPHSSIDSSTTSTASTTHCSCSSSSSPGTGSASADSSGRDGGLDGMQETYRLQQLLPGTQPTLEGYVIGNVLASYVHLHWGGCPELAAALVAKCCSIRGSSSSSSGRGVSSSAMDNSSSVVQSNDGSLTAAGTAISSKAAEAHSTPAAVATNPQPVQSPKQSTPSITCCCVAISDSGDSSSSSSSSSSRIVSLLPSGTEIVYALGLQDRLVGVSGFCDWPPAACTKPCAVRSLIDVHSLSSDEIETAMQSFKASGTSPFEVDVALLAQQQPGLVLTQDACGTCDADCSLVCRATLAAGLSTSSTKVLVLHPTTLSEVLDSITSIATAAGVPDRAQQLVAELRARLQVVAAAVRRLCPSAAAVTVDQTTVAEYSVRLQQAEAQDTLGADPASLSSSPGGGGPAAAAAAAAGGPAVAAPAPAAAACQCLSPDGPAVNQAASQSSVGLPAALQPWQHAPRVLSLEGLNPLVLGGQWLPDVKLAAGAVDASGQRPGDAPARISWDQVVAFAPDVLLLCPCSRSTAAAMPDVTRLTQLPGFRDLPAVQSGRVYVIDHSYFSRPGPRLVEGVELLFELLWGQQGSEWGSEQQHCADQAAAGVGQQESGKRSHGTGNLPLRGSAETHAEPAAPNGGVVKAASSSAGTACGHEQASQVCVGVDEPTGPAVPCGGLLACAEQEPGNEHAVLRIKCLPDGSISWVPL